MRTTVDLDGPVLRELKRLQKTEGKSLGRLVSDLLVQALGARRAGQPRQPRFHWIARPMGARVDLTDKEAVHRLMDQGSRMAPDSRR